MQVVLIILSIVVLGVIINYAVSTKSSRIVRLVALGALGLIALSLGVASAVIALSDHSHDAEEVHLPIFLSAQAEAPKDKGNLVEIIIFLAFLAVIVALIANVAYKDHKQKLAEAKKTGASRLFPSAAKTSDTDLKTEEKPEKAKDDEFSLELE